MRLTPAALYRILVPLPDDLPPARRETMRRIEARLWCAVLLSMLVGWGTRVLIGQAAPDPDTAAGAHLVAALVPGLPVAALVLRFAFGRHAALWRQEARTARLEGALLVARTAAHRLNNALAPVVGYAELLTLAAGAPDASTGGAGGSGGSGGTGGRATDPAVRVHAARIFEAAGRAAADVALLQRIVRLEEDRTGPIAVLDLEASTTN